MRTTNKLFLTLATGFGLCAPAFAQNAPVHVKMIRVIDGDSTVIEKDIDESQLPEFEKQMQEKKGKDVRVMMFVEKGDAGRLSEGDHFFSFDFNDDSLLAGRMKNSRTFSDSDIFIRPGAHFFSFSDSMPGKMIRKEIVNGRDTMVFMMPDMKDLSSRMEPFKGFEFRTTEDGKFDFRFDTTFVNGLPKPEEMEKMMNGFMYNYRIENDNGNEKVIIRSRGPDSTGKMTMKKFEGKPGDDFSEDVIISSPNGKGVRRVIVKTQVKIEDVDDAPVNGKISKKEEKLDDLHFYPNPSDGKFNLDLQVEGKTPVTITITDVSGRQVYREEIKGEGKHSTSFDLTKEGKGTYIMNLQQGKKSTTRKIIVE